MNYVYILNLAARPGPYRYLLFFHCFNFSTSQKFNNCSWQHRMPLIDGVGDEVVQFAVVVLVVLVAALAWWSTNARPDRYRTVLVMRSRVQHPITVSIRTSKLIHQQKLGSLNNFYGRENATKKNLYFELFSL